MTDFWEHKLCNQKLSFYMLAPFVEEAGRMLIAASPLWHSWSCRRKDELKRMGNGLCYQARTLRSQAFGWSQHVPALKVEHSYLQLSGIAHQWYFGGEKVPPEEPEMVPYLVAGAVRILLAISPVYQKIADRDYSTHAQRDIFLGDIETLMESPCVGAQRYHSLRVSDEMMRQLFTKAALTECYGLAHTMAIAEDNFWRHQEKCGKKRRYKPSVFTREQMEELAESIGTSFENVEAAMTTEFSSWWNVATMYNARVDQTRSAILDSFRLAPEYRTNMEAAWITGMPSHGEFGGPDCHSEYDRELVERCVRTFIGYFRLLIDESNAGTLFTPTRVLIGP